MAPATHTPLAYVSGDYVTIKNNEITNRRPGSEATLAGICINTYAPSAPVYGLLITDNDIHHCGRIPSSNHDHGIYLTSTRDATIRNNQI